MACPLVRFEVEDQVCELGPGETVGRSWCAGLSIDDGHMSEAHALVSLRGGLMKLLPLRGVISLGGESLSEIVLEPGQVIHLGPSVRLVVRDVQLPGRVLVLSGGKLRDEPLWAVSSLPTVTSDHLERGLRAEALAQFWDRGDGWSVRIRGSAPMSLAPNDVLNLEGTEFTVRTQALRAVGPIATLHDPSRAAIKLVAKYDTATLSRESGDVLQLGGIAARLLSELVSLGVPAPWTTIAAEIWPDEVERGALRRKWDVALSRLRRRLSEAGFRRDLVVADGLGNFELLLGPKDTIEDRQ